MPRLGPLIREILMRHDLLVSVGGDLFPLSLPDDVDPMPPGLAVVHLDVDPWELGKNYPARVAIQGDAKATLPELAEALRRHAGCAGAEAGAPPGRGAPRSRSFPRAPGAARPTSSWSRRPSPRRPACGPSSAAPTRRASSACAAAASAGGWRPPPAGRPAP